MNARKTFPVKLRVEVSSEVQTEKKDKLVLIDNEIDEIQAEKSEASSDFNRRLKDARKFRKDLLETIKTGIEEVEIECYKEPDYQRNEMLTRRADNDEILEEYSVPLTAADRQLAPDALNEEGAEDASEEDSDESDDEDDTEEGDD
jgi:hypothetical protein